MHLNMKSDRVNLSLPSNVKEKAQTLADRLHGGKISHMFSQFVSREFERIEARDRLAVLLEEGFNSPVIEMDPDEYFDKARARVQARSK